MGQDLRGERVGVGTETKGAHPAGCREYERLAVNQILMTKGTSPMLKRAVGRDHGNAMVQGNAMVPGWKRIPSQ